jgi:hypothetical protein
MNLTTKQAKPSMAQFLAGKGQIQTQRPAKIDQARILIDLGKLIMKPNVTSALLIEYMEKYPIDPNTYLLSPHRDMQIPLIYHCCSNPDLTEFFNYLLNKGVNVLAEMVCESDPSHQIELLYYSQTQYIPALIRRGCRLRPEGIGSCGEKLLIKGNITKLMTLYKHGAVTKTDLLLLTQRPYLIFRVLDHLYERMFNLCQANLKKTKETSSSTGTEELRPLIEEVMKNYMNVFKLFFKNGVSVNQIENGETFLQKVLNTYFIELIKLTIEYQPNYDHIDFLHYSNFQLTNRQVMGFFYNDANHKLIQEFLKDKIVPEKINVKKVMLKKKSKITDSDQAE